MALAIGLGMAEWAPPYACPRENGGRGDGRKRAGNGDGEERKAGRVYFWLAGIAGQAVIGPNVGSAASQGRVCSGSLQVWCACTMTLNSAMAIQQTAPSIAPARVPG